MNEETLFGKVSGWLLNQWPIVVIAIVVISLGFIPQIRDGIKILSDLFPKKKCPPKPSDPMVIMGETVKFEELISSRDNDVIKVICYTHDIGINAEREWIRRHYPDWKFVKQGLTSLEYMSKETGKNKKFFDGTTFFDQIEIRHPSGRTKSIFFDISEFFTSVGTSSTDPSAFIAEKIRTTYGKK